MPMRGRKIPKLSSSSLCASLLLLLSSFLTLTGGLRPFFPAVACAALAAGLNPMYLAIAALFTLRPALWAAFLVGVGLNRALQKLEREPRAALCALASGAAGAYLTGADWTAAAASGLLALALAPALVAGLRLTARRRVLSPDEKISLAAACAMALSGLSASHPACALLSQALAAFLTAVSAREGAASGALTGLISGASTLSGSGFALWLGLSGAAAGGLRALPRWAASLGLLAALALGNVGLAPLLAAAMGLTLHCAVPHARPRLLHAFARARPDTTALRRLRAACKSVRGMRLALDECARACRQVPEPEASDSLAAVMRERLCDGCPDRAKCWSGASPQPGRLFARLTAQPDSAETTPDQVRFCRRAASIPRRLSGAVAAARQKQSAQRERLQAAQLSAGPLEQAARMLEELEARLARSEPEDDRAAQLAEAAVDRLGGAALVSATASSLEVDWSAHVKSAARAFSQALGGAYVQQSPDRFVPAPALQITSALCSRGAAPGSPCGDRALRTDLGDGRVALILSDGMGRGQRAAEESRSVVTLLNRLLLAGAQPLSAIQAVNSVMRLRGGDRFATLDLCLLDARRGEAAFYKLGACLSVLVRRGVCLRVEGGQLPPGVVEPAQPHCVRMRLRAGDTVVMVSDGIADFAREGQEDWLTTQLASLSGLSARALAHALVSAAARRDQNNPRDDMTALCAHVEKWREEG